MPKNNQPKPGAATATSWDLKTFYKIAGVSVAAVLLFLSGWAIGSGRVTLSNVKSLNSNVSSSPNYSEVTEVYNLLRTKYDGKLTERQLLDGMMRGMADATGDPHTAFFSSSEAKEFNEQLAGKIVGIGAQLSKSSNGYIEVVSPISGSPAEKAGLKSKDIIAAVNGDSTAGWQVDKAVSKIRGDKGTSVELTIVRGGGEPFKITIVRDEISVPSVESEILPGNIGYMKINQFSENTADLAKQAAQKFADAKIKSTILDVRGNPGGYVDQAVSVASLWLPKGKLIMQEKRGGNTVISSEYANGQNPLLGVPLVVLTDGGSASASEIVAGALKDNNVATIIGEKSYGKGSVQEPIDLDSGALIKITIAKWYRPNGKNIDKVGITPDKIVKFTEEDATAGRDPQKDAAITKLTQ